MLANLHTASMHRVHYVYRVCVPCRSPVTYAVMETILRGIPAVAPFLSSSFSSKLSLCQMNKQVVKEFQTLQGSLHCQSDPVGGHYSHFIDKETGTTRCNDMF